MNRSRYTAALPMPIAPMVDTQTGMISSVWFGWMMALFQRTGGGVGAGPAYPSTALPLMDATPAVVGIEGKYAQGDHVHPTDTSRAAQADLVATQGTLSALTANMALPGVPVALGASPFVYTAPSHGAVLVAGSGVIRLEITANGATFYPTGSYYGAFPLAAGSSARMTYIGSPTMVFIPT